MQFYYPSDQKTRDEAVDAKIQDLMSWSKTFWWASIVMAVFMLASILTSRYITFILFMLLQWLLLGLSVGFEIKARKLNCKHYHKH